MRITIRYGSIDRRTQMDTPRYRSIIEVSEQATIEKLVANLGARGLSNMVDGVASEEVLTSGRLEEGIEYLLEGYILIKMKEKIKRRFPNAETNLVP